MHDVFISYSSREYPEAETVRMTLEENGISCWMAPGSIPGGSNYTKEIPVAIRECRVFVLILSEKAQNSHWVLKELDAAVGHGKVVLPFMLHNFALGDEFSFLLSGTQWYSAYQDADAELEKMIARIRDITSKPREPVRAPKISRPRPLPKAEPVPAPAAEPGAAILCPACGSAEVVPIEKESASYSAMERIRFWSVPLVMCAAFSAVFAALGSLGYWFFGNSYRSTMVLLTEILIFLCAAAAAILAAILTVRSIREKIRRKRIRKHIRACGVLCQTCAKKFRVVIPAGKSYPWEG